MSYVATLQTSRQTESAYNATSKCIKVTTIMSLLRDMKLTSRDRIFLSHYKSVDLTGVLSCRVILFECLRHNLLSLLQVFSMWRHKPDLLLFRSIPGTGDLLSKHALGILWYIIRIVKPYLTKLYLQSLNFVFCNCIVATIAL